VGGGRHPLVGAERVAKALDVWGRQARKRGFSYRPALVNGDPGVVFYDADGRAVWVTALEIADGVVVAIRSILNPDKLAHIRA
jgi:RNA polymerase sigma-70 factor (ECF subfamily)